MAVVDTAFLRPRRRRRTDAPVVAALFCAVLVAWAIAAPLLMPFDPNAPNFESVLRPPFWEEDGSRAHLLGTDQLGRDILSRIMLGAQVSLLTAFVATVCAGTFGIALGIVGGYAGGLIDMALMRLVDTFLALPFILMALALVAALGAGLGNIIVVIALTNWARYARLVRSEVLSVKSRPFVDLAKVSGLSETAIVLRHILPNVLNSVLVLAVLDIARTIILESSLSFLGLGVQPPDVSWGLMLADGRNYMLVAWWLTALPGAFIALAVLSFNAVGEWAKRHFDPRGSVETAI